jgi:TRAP-type C4-dicarboxylate transport system substrate-binding protein
MAFISKKWFDALPSDLQTIIDADALKVAAEINPLAADFYESQRKVWTEHGELISLPADEQAEMMKILAEVGADVAKRKPKLEKAYNVFVEVAKRRRQ